MNQFELAGVTAGLTVLFGFASGAIIFRVFKERLIIAATGYVNQYLEAFFSDVQQNPAKFAGIVKPMLDGLIGSMTKDALSGKGPTGDPLMQMVQSLPLPKPLKGLAGLYFAFQGQKRGIGGETSNSNPFE